MGFEVLEVHAGSTRGRGSIEVAADEFALSGPLEEPEVDEQKAARTDRAALRAQMLLHR